MELTGQHTIPASRQKVWEALHDPDILKACITGCQSLEMVSDDQILAKVQAKVGPVKATFDGEAKIVDSLAPERYTLVGEGKGGVAGFAKGSADVTLAEDGEATLLTYVAKAQVGGKLAQLGSRLVDSTAKRYAADFFQTLSDKVSEGAVANEPGVDVLTEARPDVAGRVDEAAGELEASKVTPVSSPRPEEAVDRELETAAGRGFLGGPWFWGILAFAVVILVLLALR